MSICIEGWEADVDVYFTIYCPALDRGDYKSCLLGQPMLPETCPHVVALKAVVENPKLILAVQESKVNGE